jgi:DNA-directed RNA polymerase subunit RPC12/RpoP
VTCTDASSSFATFSGMKTVIGFYCGGAGCHNEGQPPPFFPDNDATLYRTLMEYRVPTCGGRVLVKPCAPDESAFYRAQLGTCDALPRMPFGCGTGSCTSDQDLEDVRQWIAKGAPMD